MYAIKQIKICAEYRDMLPRPRLDLSGTPGLRPIGLSPGPVFYLVFLKLFLRLPVVLSSSPLKILEGFCCGIHRNRIHVIRNVLICFIEEGLFCLYNGSNTDKIWNYIFQRGQSSMVAIGPVRLCLVKIYIYEKTTFWLKMIWHKIGPSKNCHISPSYTTGHGVSNDAKYSVVYSSQLSMMGTRSWCVTS